MAEWEYLSIVIHWDAREHKDWVVRCEDGSALVGLEATLAAYGAEGWELVGLNPDGFRAFKGFEEWDLEPRLYRATFKRPAQG